MEIVNVKIPASFELKGYGQQAKVRSMLKIMYPDYEVVGFSIKHNPESKIAMLKRCECTQKTN